MNAIITEKAARQALYDEYKLRKAILKRDYPKFAFVGDASTTKTREAHLKYGKKYYVSESDTNPHQYAGRPKPRGLLIATRLAGANSEALLFSGGFPGVKKVKLSDIRETYKTPIDKNISIELKIKTITSIEGDALYILDKKEDVHICIRCVEKSRFDLVLYVADTATSTAAVSVRDSFSPAEKFTGTIAAPETGGYIFPLFFIGRKSYVINNMDIIRLFDLNYILDHIQASDTRMNYKGSSQHTFSYANTTISKYVDVLYDALDSLATPTVLHFGRLTVHMFNLEAVVDLNHYVQQLTRRDDVLVRRLQATSRIGETFTPAFIDYKGKMMVPSDIQESLEMAFRWNTPGGSLTDNFDTLYPPNYKSIKQLIAKDVINNISKISHIKGSPEERSFILTAAAKLIPLKANISTR